jgi:hypothetical protein
MDCKICRRSSFDEVNIRWMKIVYDGTEVCDGMICRDCCNIVVTNTKELFVLKDSIDQILKGK